MKKEIVRKIEDLKTISTDVEEIILDLDSYKIDDYQSIFTWFSNTNFYIATERNLSIEEIKNIILLDSYINSHYNNCQIKIDNLLSSSELSAFVNKLKTSNYSELEKLLVVFNEFSLDCYSFSTLNKSTLIIKYILDQIGIENYLSRRISFINPDYDNNYLVLYINDRKYMVDGVYEACPNHLKDENKFEGFLYNINSSYAFYYFKSGYSSDHSSGDYYDDLAFLNDKCEYNKCLIDLPYLLNMNESVLNKMFKIDKTPEEIYKEAEKIYLSNIKEGINKLEETLKNRKIESNFLFNEMSNAFCNPGTSMFFLLAASIIYNEAIIDPLVEAFTTSAFSIINDKESRISVFCKCDDVYEWLKAANEGYYREEVISRIAKILYINELKKSYINSKYTKIDNIIPKSTFKKLFLNMSEEIGVDQNDIDKILDSLFFIKNAELINNDQRLNYSNSIYASKVEDVKIDIPNFITNNSSLIIYLDFENYNETTLLEVVKRANEIKRSGYLPVISIKALFRNFTDDEINDFINIKKNMNAHGYELYFDGGYKDTYTLEELIKADQTLDAIIKKVKESPLSQFEKFLYIYNYLTSKPYNCENLYFDQENPHTTRDIISITNTNSIVCAGYSVLMYYICKEVGIKCFCQYVNVSTNKNSNDPHQNNLVYIKDEKYNIDGLYYSDSCWDSIEKGKNETGYDFCLVNLDDRENIGCVPFVMDDLIFLYQNDNDFLYICEHTKKLITLSPFFDIKGEMSGDEFLLELKDKEFYQSIYDEAYKITNENIAEAVDEIIKDFKDSNVPIDVFDTDYIIWGCSLEFFVALKILKAKNIHLYIERLLGYYNKYIKGSEKKLPGCYYKYCTYQINSEKNDYEKLFKEFIENDFYHIRFNSVVDIIFAVNLLPKLKMLIRLYPYSKKGEEVPIETYEKALKEVFRFDGLSEEEINKKILERINLSIERAPYCYYGTASNVFRKRYDKLEDEKNK